jgi:hypothetical protein
LAWTTRRVCFATPPIEKYRVGRQVEGYIDDFASHVFFTRELQLVFIHCGLEVEEIIGDYRGRPLSPTSRVIITIGGRN